MIAQAVVEYRQPDGQASAGNQRKSLISLDQVNCEV